MSVCQLRLRVCVPFCCVVAASWRPCASYAYWVVVPPVPPTLAEASVRSWL